MNALKFLIFVAVTGILAAVSAAADTEDRPRSPGTAQSRTTGRAYSPFAYRVLGHGGIFTNDFLGDRKDRWQTGSYAQSIILGLEDWRGQAPGSFGDLLEIRFGAGVMASNDLTRLDPADRPWAGRLFLGVQTHWTYRALEFNLGGDLVFVGPYTQLDHLQEVLHSNFGDRPSALAVLDYQIGNRVIPTLSGEMGRSFRLRGGARLRPFAQMRVGDESLLRVGADLMIGPSANGGLMSRDLVTGQRYRVAGTSHRGLGLILGADTARVFDSVYLPSDRGFALTDARNRLRAGVRWQGDRWSVFYGATWLGREFAGQSGSQVVGSVSLKVRF